MSTARTGPGEKRAFLRGAGFGALLVGAGVLVGMAAQQGPKVIGVCGGDNRIYRVYDNGNVEMIGVGGNEPRTASGVAGWVAIPIDPNLRRQW